MEYGDFSELSGYQRFAVIIAAAVAAHLLVMGIKWLTRHALHIDLRRGGAKARTVVTLISSIAVFGLYFAAFGYALSELGVSLQAYFASASIIGLAVAFGSQGIVQDVVMGLTIIFSDLFDVGDMVEIGGQVGIVRRLGMRFTILENSFGSQVFIPNRSIMNVINYPRGYLRCLADITLAADDALADKMEAAIRRVAGGFGEQMPGLLITPPDYEGRINTSAGRRFLRVKFRIWPGRGAAIENEFRKEIFATLKKLDETYTEWMISINYEVEQRRGR